MTYPSEQGNVAHIVTTLHPGHYARLRSMADDDEAVRMLKHCNIYMIISRPRIVASLVTSPLFANRIQYRSEASGVFEELNFNHSQEVAGLNLNVLTGHRVSGTAQVKEDGSRVVLPISYAAGVEADVCHVATLASPTSYPGPMSEVSKWEILYIGIAQNSEGTRSAIDRLSKGHEKLRMIYEDKLRNSEVHVVPIMVKSTSFNFHPMPEPQGPHFCVDGFTSFHEKLTKKGSATRELLNIIENSLIAHFQPSYNKLLKSWPASKEAKAFSDMGVHGMMLGYDGSDDIAHLFSSNQPKARRGFAFYAELRGGKRLLDVEVSTEKTEIPRHLLQTSRGFPRRSLTSPPAIRMFTGDFRPLGNSSYL
ncbi:hypothetical protein [Nocardia salmonicida]|uniref:hypothetical protein n=1 Tax=Nocardia salmonicida TaxID=53431 RepID=UPI003CF1B4C0